MVTRFDTSTETPKCSEMLFRQPDGEDEANVALTTRLIDTIVMYHLRPVDQFLGFSISFGEKSRCLIVTLAQSLEANIVAKHYTLARLGRSHQCPALFYSYKASP